MTPRLILIAHNLRSTHNVGSLLRTADGLGVERVVFTGYTPYPAATQSTSTSTAADDRLPHIAAKLDRQIHVSALGAEATVAWEHEPDIFSVIDRLRASNWQIAAIEQDDTSISLPLFVPAAKVALIVGREVEGIEPDVRAQADVIIEIPMFGSKESYNVAQAAAMALYHCRVVAS